MPWPSYIDGCYPLVGRPRYPELWDGCIGAYCPLLGPTGLTLHDMSPYHHDGTLTNMTAGSSWQIRSGYQSLRCNEASNRVLLNRTGLQLFPAGSAFTVSSWFIADASQPSAFGGYLFADASGATAGTLFLRVHNSVNIQAFTDPASASDIITASNVVSEGAMTHVAWVVKNATNKELFVNGRSYGTAAVAYTRSGGSTAALCGSGTYGDVDITFRGNLLETRLYSRSLSDAVIRLLARRPAIAHETAPTKYRSQQVTSNRRRRLLIGAH